MTLRISLVGFVLSSAAVLVYFGAPPARSSVARTYVPGETSFGHHAIESRCESCHVPYQGVPNEACNRCHGTALEAAIDSHAEGKFADVGNATRLGHLDARACVTCHREHVEEKTRRGGAVVPADFCVECHADVGTERPSHEGFAFDGCASSGCHNYHDNRALNESFLEKHLGEPDVLTPAMVLVRRSAEVPELTLEADDAVGEPDEAAPENEATPVVETASVALTIGDEDAPSASEPAEIVDAWARSAHAATGLNCTGCHAQASETAGEFAWATRVGDEPCTGCHPTEDSGFRKGMHGMSVAVGLPSRRPATARLAMKSEARDREVRCTSCHDAHDVDTVRAAVDACLSCHDDEHSRSYAASRHARLWQEESSGAAPAGSGVSCATCHLPREVHDGAVLANHDQSANLRPRDHMVRDVCMRCHGAGFSFDALADDALVDRNFNGRPAVHVRSLDLAAIRFAAKAGVARPAAGPK